MITLLIDKQLCERITPMAHEHVRSIGISEKTNLTFPVTSLAPQGFTTEKMTERVQFIAGGGFGGSVIGLESKVIKTMSPSDAAHEILRNINWNIPFPSQTLKEAALQDYYTGKLLHLLLPHVTNDMISNPDAYGITNFEKVGYGQVREKISGRGPTFHDQGKEKSQIADARKLLWNLGVEMGFEHAAQVHPDNPFGKPNLWIGPDGKTKWLDDLPAIRHTGFVKPLFYYKFHTDVRQAFESEVPTFNTLHTDRLRNFLQKNPQIPEHIRDEADFFIQAYDEVHEIVQDWSKRNPRELYIQDALTRGIIDPETAQRLTNSRFLYETHMNSNTARLGLRAFWDLVNKTPAKIIWNRESQKNAWKFITDAHYRHEQALENTMLWGVKKAYDNGLLSEEEFQQSLSFIPDHELELYEGLQLTYLLTSRLTDLATPIVAAALVSHPAEALAITSAFNFFGPGIIRAAATEIVGLRLRKNLHRMAGIAALPMLGAYTAIPIDLSLQYGKEAENLSHYTLRSIVALASKLRPGGGWGSDAEEKIWNLVNRSKNTP